MRTFEVILFILILLLIAILIRMVFVKSIDNYTEEELCEKSGWCQFRKSSKNNGTIFVCQPLGGLGNQLFPIFNIIALAKQTGYQFRIIREKMSGDKRPTYWTNFLKELEPYLLKDKVSYDYTYNEPTFAYNQIDNVLPYIDVKNQDKNFVLISGYFQSVKYFEKHKDYIIDLLKIPQLQSQVVKKMTQVDFKNTIVSLHFRIGDYADASTGLVLPLMKIDYYIKALWYVNQSLNNPFQVLYFYERDDQKIVDGHISKLSSAFPQLKFIPIMKGLEDWEELLIMSCCHHNIIPNSTFGWWGAYLNSNPDKIVCYPSVWFGPVHQDENTDDLCPTSWKKINI